MDISQLLRGESLNKALGRLLPADRLVRDLLSSLRPGQTLQARVQDSPRPDVARLQIQDVTVTARTARPLTPGQTLKLTVVEGGDTPQLRVLDAQRPASGQDVLRLSLPRQLPLRESLGQLTRLSERALPLLVPRGREALQSLLLRSIPLRQLSADRVRQTVQDSGLFTEARMAAGKPPSPGDQKLLLLRLAEALPSRPAAATPAATAPAAGQGTGSAVTLAAQAAPAALSRAALAGNSASLEGDLPAPLSRTLLQDNAQSNAHQLAAGRGHPAAAAASASDPQAVVERLWRLVEASLARIHTHQAASLPRDDQPTGAFQLEIPLTLPGLPPQAVDLRIEAEAEAEKETDSEAGWLVTLGFQFSELGPVKAGVRLAGGRISTTFWCEHPQALQRFDRELPTLHAALEAAGLEVAHLAASRGRPPGDATTTPQDRLLDERV